MDAEKQKALDAVKDGRPYDVNGVRCLTAGDVNKAWKDGLDVVAEVTSAVVADEKPKEKKS